MTILTFEFEDRLRGWSLEKTDFSQFNLLVGASGVGKTRILESLNRVRRAAIQNAKLASGCVWNLELQVEGKNYIWSAETTSRVGLGEFDDDDADEGESSGDSVRFLRESVTLSDGSTLFHRSENELELNGVRLPRIKNTESVIGLMSDEEKIKPLNRAMRRFLFSSANDQPRSFVQYDKRQMERVESKIKTLDDLRDTNGLHVLMKALIMQNKFPDDFRMVIDQYREIFDQVEEVKIGSLSDFDPNGDDSPGFPPGFPMEWITAALRERGVPHMLIHHRISSGMVRTLMHLLELALAPAGSVVLIDEFENSLGVNCLPQVAEHVLARSMDLQFLVTSHHPYVINNVPTDVWRVVTRHGCKVSVLDSRHIPALASGSHHDRFTILTNLREYEHGVQ